MPFAPYVGGRSTPDAVAAQENLAQPPQANGLPKELSPAKIKTFKQCKAQREKMEADMESGALSAADYAKTLVRFYCLRTMPPVPQSIGRVSA